MVAVILGAFNCALELAMHQVDNDRLAPLKMILPRFLTRLHIVVAVILNHRHEGLLLDAIKVLVQAV